MNVQMLGFCKDKVSASYPIQKSLNRSLGENKGKVRHFNTTLVTSVNFSLLDFFWIKMAAQRYAKISLDLFNFVDNSDLCESLAEVNRKKFAALIYATISREYSILNLFTLCV